MPGSLLASPPAWEATAERREAIDAAICALEAAEQYDSDNGGSLGTTAEVLDTLRAMLDEVGK